jgi:hypothetical protein
MFRFLEITGLRSRNASRLRNQGLKPPQAKANVNDNLIGDEIIQIRTKEEHTSSTANKDPIPSITETAEEPAISNLERLQREFCGVCI